MLALERTRPESCLSDLAIDRLLANDVDDVTAARARAHLSECERCQAREQALASESRAFQSEGPPLRLGEVVPLVPRQRRRAQWLAAGSVSLAAAAALLFVVNTLDGSTNRRNGAVTRNTTNEPSFPMSGDNATARKGADGKISFFIKRGDVVQPSGAGAVVYPEDQLRFTYTLSEPAYMAVLSRDGAGVASVYYPASGEVAERVEAATDAPLPQSTILDATLGQETLYGLFCKSAVALEPLRQALEKQPEAPAWPEECTVHSIGIEKRAL